MEAVYPRILTLAELLLLQLEGSYGTGTYFQLTTRTFSSYSDSVRRMQKNNLTDVERFGIGREEFFVVELAINDGYLLPYL